MKKYNKVYDFTNENVSCLKNIYNFEGSKVLSVVGSGDQYFSSILNGAKQVDLFDINPTSYLYFVLKFYSIRELTFEEFYKLLILKNFNNVEIYNKLEKFLPLEVLKYYKYLMDKSTFAFTTDGVNLFTKKNQKYYFNNSSAVIPYLVEEKYYKLQEILKRTNLPNFDEVAITDLKIKNNYDILLTSNIYKYVNIDVFDYIKLLKNFDIPQIQAGYDWYGQYLNEFICLGCLVNTVLSSSPSEYYTKKNYVYSIKK